LQFNQFMVEEVKPSLALTDVRKEIEVLKGVYSFEAEEKGITLSFTFKQGNYQCYTANPPKGSYPLELSDDG